VGDLDTEWEVIHSTLSNCPVECIWHFNRGYIILNLRALLVDIVGISILGSVSTIDIN